MDKNIYETPKSNIREAEELQHSAINKPKARWLVAAWMLFALGILSSRVGIMMAGALEGDDLFARRIGTVLLIAVLGLIYGIVSLNRRLCQVAAVVCILSGIFQAYGVLTLMLSNSEIQPIVGSFILFVVPAFIVAWYLLRSSFLELAMKNRKYKEMISMNKHVAKKLRKAA